MAKIRPLGARVLVEPVDPKEQNKGGIIIPDNAKEKPQEGLVIAIGTKVDDDGKPVLATPLVTETDDERVRFEAASERRARRLAHREALRSRT